MKKFKSFIIGCVLLLSSLSVFSAVMQGEYTPGVYVNSKVAADGTIYTEHGVYGTNTVWLTSAVRIATQTLADQTNTVYPGIIVRCNVTAVPTVETLTIKVQGKELVSGTYFDVAANTATTTTGLITLTVSPRLTAVTASTAGQTVNAYLPQTWRVTVIHSASGNWTYSCTYDMIGY